MRKAIAWGPLVLCVSACGGSPSGPTSPPIIPDVPRPSVSEIRIGGLPRSLAPGATAQLTAEVVLETGTVKLCADPGWAVDDANVARVSSAGLLTAGISGYVKVTATCEGFSTWAETKVEAIVEAAKRHHLEIIAYDSEVPHGRRSVAPLWATTMEFLDGPRAGQRTTPERIYSEGMPDVAWPVKVRFFVESYEPKDFILSEATGERRNPTSHEFLFQVPMTFAADALTDTYTGAFSEPQMVSVHPFSMRMPGTVQVRTWWGGSYNDHIYVELWCGGKMLRRISQSTGSSGNGFRHDVAAPGTCEVRLGDDYGNPAFRVAITYPR